MPYEHRWERDDKIVDYNKYCKDCIYCDNSEFKEPCHDCLNEPANQDSHKPVKFIRKNKKG